MPLVEPGPELTRAQRHRYARHLLMPQIGEAGQRRLLNARVAVVGAGGLGSPALLYLAAAGVGHLTIIDDDDVDATNLQRQVVHDTSGLGSPKVDSAAFRIHALNPGIEVTTRRMRLDPGNADRLLAGHDLVLDGADNFDTRYTVADACERLGLVHVWASVFRTQAQLSAFRRPGTDGEPGIGLRDLFPAAPDAADVPSCADAGVLGSLCGQVGSMMATEAVKLVCGIGRPLFGRLVFIDALDTTQREIVLRPAASSAPTQASPVPAAGTAGGATAASPTTPPDADGDLALVQPEALAHVLAGGPRPLVLDVREPAEWEMGTIDGALLLSLGDLLDGAPVPLDRPVVVTCKTGPRALRAAAELRRRGAHEVAVLAGGMAAWTSRIDPSMIRY